MIIVKLTGGLGNQLFQFAIGKSLSIKMKQRLMFDISSFEWDSIREFSLDKILKQYEIATKEDFVKVTSSIPKFSDRLFYKLINKEIPYFKKSLIKESKFTFDPNYPLYSSPHLYLEGYWQSENYFKDIRPYLLNEIRFENLTPKTYYYKNIIESHSESVSIHVRRGDYASNPDTTNFHGLMNKTYYLKAIQLLSSKLENPYFFVFSDDKEFVKTMFEGFDNIEFIEGLTYDYEDLYLMSLCKHQIIANSSFSWWGAWLNRNERKEIIAPKQWFHDEEMQSKTTDLIPSSWIKI